MCLVVLFLWNGAAHCPARRHKMVLVWACSSSVAQSASRWLLLRGLPGECGDRIKSAEQSQRIPVVPAGFHTSVVLSCLNGGLWTPLFTVFLTSCSCFTRMTGNRICCLKRPPAGSVGCSQAGIHVWDVTDSSGVCIEAWMSCSVDC